MINLSSLPFNIRLLLEELQTRGIQIDKIGDTDLIQASYGNHYEYLLNYMTRLTPTNYTLIFNDKFYSKNLLSQHGFSVNPGAVFSSKEIETAVSFASAHYPVVVKPTFEEHGNLAFVQLKDEQAFRAAFAEISRYISNQNILVESYFEGDDYRFLVIEPDVVAIVHRIKPYVIGNGKSTIFELIKVENQRRKASTTCLCPIFIQDWEGRRILFEQNLTLDSVPKSGEKIVLRYNGNVSWGAECVNADKAVHPSFIELAWKIHRLFPQNGFTSIDLLIKDAHKEATCDNYTFIEFNSSPGFSLHLMPSCGRSYNVLEPIVDLLFPETACIK